MMSKILILSIVLSAIASIHAQDITLKAPSLAVNCGCQCDNYIFRDARGRTQGNCRSTDFTGARWCYVRPGNTCTDTRPSRRSGFRRISYEACATPRCGGGFGIGGGFGNGGFGNGGFGNGGFGNGGFGRFRNSGVQV